MRNGIICSLIALCLMGMTACSGGGDKEAQSRAEKQKAREQERAALKIAVMPTMDCLPLYLLKDSLMYDTTKVDIRLKRFTAQMDCDTALVGGSVQGAVTDLVRANRMKQKGGAK